MGAAPPPNMRFGGLLQGNLYQGPMGDSFNILNPNARRLSYAAREWPTFEDGTMVKGVTHRWKYTVYFRPSVRDNDFPPSWTSEEQINSETVLTATIPPKVAVFTVSPDGLDMNRVSAALVKIRYRATLEHAGGERETIKSAKIRPGGPDVFRYFYDDKPKTNLPCEYQYTLLYQGAPAYTSPWMPEEGGIVIPIDPNYGASPAAAPGGPGPIIDDSF
jgi:hypothetical protein